MTKIKLIIISVLLIIFGADITSCAESKKSTTGCSIVFDTLSNRKAIDKKDIKGVVFRGNAGTLRAWVGSDRYNWNTTIGGNKTIKVEVCRHGADWAHPGCDENYRKKPDTFNTIIGFMPAKDKIILTEDSSGYSLDGVIYSSIIKPHINYIFIGSGMACAVLGCNQDHAPKDIGIFTKIVYENTYDIMPSNIYYPVTSDTANIRAYYNKLSWVDSFVYIGDLKNFGHFCAGVKYGCRICDTTNK